MYKIYIAAVSKGHHRVAVNATVVGSIPTRYK